MDKKIVIAGCAQTIAPYIASIFKNMYMITKLFKEYKIIIFENNSTDDTHQLLSHYQKKDSNCILLSEKKLPIPSRFHAHRVAYCRNKLLERIHESFGEYDYMVMMDMDDVCASLLQIVHFKNIFKNSTWDAVSFNKSPYYDLWALRYTPFHHNFRNLSNNPKRYNYYRHCLEEDIAKRLKKKSMISVLSAFGGFAIYKIPKIKNCKYDARNRDIFISRIYYAEDCEHVAFHHQMREKNDARIFLSSSILFPSNVPNKVLPSSLMSRLISHK